MDYTYNFSIDFIPIYFDSANNNPLMKFGNIISEEAAACIRKIHSEINNRKVTSKNHSVVNRIHNGVFCCCFGTGAAIFTIRLNMTPAPAKSPIILTGYFIPEYCLRTAWKVFRREVITICIGGADSHEENIITKNAAEIFESADRVYSALSDDLKQKADKVVNDMEGVSVPYNFAYTEFPLKYMPVVFEASTDSSFEFAEGAESNKIIFVSNQIKKKEDELRDLYPYAESMRLVVNNRKTYLNIQKEEYKNTRSKSEFRSFSRELDSRTDLQREFLWFFKREVKNITFVSLVNEIGYTHDLEAGNTVFTLIPVMMRQANIEIDHKISDMKVSPVPKDEEKKAGGLFSGWGHKKK